MQPNQLEGAKITSVVVNWNRPDDTLECLHSLSVQERVNLNLLVVDNGSSDDSVDRIQGAHPEATLIQSPVNLRFAGGYNLGIQRALDTGAEFIFLINNDAIASPDTVINLLAYASQTDIGLVAPIIYYAASPDRIWSIGALRRRWLLEVKGDHRNQQDSGGWPPVIERDFVTGCCFLAPRYTFEKVGLFDERFTHYYEDSDFCLRVRKQGLRILVVPDARVWHKVALSSGGSDSPDERYWMARSSVTYFRKHARGFQWALIAAYRFGSAMRTSLRLFADRRIDSLKAYWRGLRDGLRSE